MIDKLTSSFNHIQQQIFRTITILNKIKYEWYSSSSVTDFRLVHSTDRHLSTNSSVRTYSFPTSHWTVVPFIPE